MSEILLNNGVTIPQLGFGVFQVPPEDTQRIVEDALAAGYRHIDTAAGYRNEAGVGAAIAASGIPREEIFVTTKLRNGDQGRARDAFQDSREALGLDVVDLYLIHWPVPSQGLFVQAWKELENLYAAKEIRAIGVSNFLSDHLDVLLESTPPGVSASNIAATIERVAGVENVHDLHVWAIEPRLVMLTCHVLVHENNSALTNELLKDIRARIASDFGITHITIQLETHCAHKDAVHCDLTTLVGQHRTDHLHAHH